jgi:hypothetical protein
LGQTGVDGHATQNDKYNAEYVAAAGHGQRLSPAASSRSTLDGINRMKTAKLHNVKANYTACILDRKPAPYQSKDAVQLPPAPSVSLLPRHDSS